jgi:hypothetical protein
VVIVLFPARPSLLGLTLGSGFKATAKPFTLALFGAIAAGVGGTMAGIEF